MNPNHWIGQLVITFVYNNPLRFVYPDGMKSDDWVKYEANGKLYTKWDDNVTDQKSATGLYGGNWLDL